jgi:ribosomal protein L10
MAEAIRTAKDTAAQPAKVGVLRTELASLREELERKRSELDVLRYELTHSAAKMVREGQINHALRAKTARLRISFQIEEEKQAHEAELKRRYAFS